MIKTLYAASRGAPAIDPGAESATFPTLTVTTLLPSTRVINLVHTSDLPGPYSFSENNGTTDWLGGKTPPASARLTTSTSIITLQPVSSLAPNSSQGLSAPAMTSFLTTTPTETLTHHVTKTMSYLIPTISAGAKGYPGYGPAGWNTTLTRLFKPSGSGSATNHPITYSSAVKVTPTFYGNSPRHLRARQVGQVVEATIDGFAVSWTNSYDGNDLTVSDTGLVFVPAAATAPKFFGSASTASGELLVPNSSSPTSTDFGL